MIYLYRSKDTGDFVEKEYEMGYAPDKIWEKDGDELIRIYTIPEVGFDGPDFSINQSSKSPLMRVPKRQRI